MSDPAQETTRPSRKRDRLARKAAHEGLRGNAASNSLGVHTRTPNMTCASLHSFRSLSSKSSLSGTSELSSYSRSLRTFKASTPSSPRKRTRLLPRSHKRGGRNKPIVVRDSSSGDIHSKEVRYQKPKRGAGLKNKQSENGLTEKRPQRSGPVETLEELRNLQTHVLQTLVNRDLNVERKKKRKEAAQPKKMPVPSCSSKELSRLFDLPRCIAKEFPNIVMFADVSPEDTAGIITAAEALAGPGTAVAAEDMSTTKTEPCKLIHSLEEKPRMPNIVSHESDTATSTKTSMESNPTKGHVLLEKSEVLDGIPHMEATVTSAQTPTTSNGISVALKVPLKHRESSTNSPPSACQGPGPDVTPACNLAHLDVSTANANATLTHARLLMEKNELMKTFLAIQADIKAKQETLAHVNELLQKKRMRHRDKTPGNTPVDSPMDTFQQSAASSSILAQSLASLNPEFVNAAMDLRKLEKRLGINILGPVLSGCASSSSQPSLTNANRSIDRQDITKMEGVLAIAAQQVRELGLDTIHSEMATVERQLNYIRGDLAEQEVQEVAATTSGTPVIPRTWIDESRLEAQSVGQLGEATADAEESVFAFDPVGTVSKFLDIVTYPLKYVWRIAYRF